MNASYAVPSGVLGVAFNNEACAKATALLACRVLLGVSPDPLWPRDKWFEVDELREREILVSAQYRTSRIGSPSIYRMMEAIVAARDVPQLLLKFGGSRSRKATRTKSRQSRIPSKPPHTSAPSRLDPVPSRST